MKTLSAHYPITELAETLETSASGYHAHLKKSQRLRRREDARLHALIEESFLQSQGNYGSPRITLDLRDQGERCGKNRVARLMREKGLRPAQKRRFRPQTTDSVHRHPVAENWLSKVPRAQRPGEIWQSDITYIDTDEGWLYLAFTLDACSRKVVGYHCREDLSAELSLAVLNQAVKNQPILTGLIHHSDRGVQYACGAFRDRLASFLITPSMSRPGNPYDNALAESFVATLKTECFKGFRPKTKSQANLMIFAYIESFYNPKRRHSSLGYLSPIQFESRLFPQNQKPNINN